MLVRIIDMNPAVPSISSRIVEITSKEKHLTLYFPRRINASR